MICVKYCESFSVAIHGNNWWDFPWLPGAHLQDKDTSSNHGEESSSISGSGFVLLNKFTPKCEHWGLLGLKDSPRTEKCSQTAGDNSSVKSHTVPGTSEPGVTSDS